MKRPARNSKADKKHFFGEFEKVSADRWKEMVIRDLKGADYEKKLVHNLEDGLPLEPFYCPENMDELSLYPAPDPGNFPFIRQTSDWKICEDIPPCSAGRAAELAQAGLSGGAEWVLFRGAKPRTAGGIEKLFSKIDPSKTGVCFAPGDDGISTSAALADFADKNGRGNLRGFVLCDPLGSGGKDKIKHLAKLIARFADTSPGYGCAGICGSRFHNDGATVAEETALALALGAEYLVALRENGVSPGTAAEAMTFHFSVGPVFFAEIAKLRAVRAVWAHIVERFEDGGCAPMRIHASASEVNKSVCDPEVNILRATGEAMAAVLGGADSVSIPAFDQRYRTAAAKSQAVARNTQLILREECGLHRVSDPCAGSYYVEVLTEKLAHTALEIFQEIEKRGGFLNCLANGFIKKRLEKSRSAKIGKIAAGTEALIGVNRYPIENERISGRLKKTRKSANAGADFERMRAATERYALEKGGKTPSVFLVKTGDTAMRSIRAVFSANFFATAGFEIKDGGVFESGAEAAKAAVKSRANVFVVCSEDGRHREFVPPFAEGVKKKIKNAVVTVAGKTGAGDGKKYADSGVDGFINAESNILKTLEKTQRSVGIRR